jgi:hypothetical protein
MSVALLIALVATRFAASNTMAAGAALFTRPTTESSLRIADVAEHLHAPTSQ